MKRWSITPVMVLVACLTGPAAAAPAAAVKAEAKEHFKKASQLQTDRKWDEAIAEYQAAWDLVQLPDLLFDLGQVYRLKGDQRKAVEHYRKYLDAAPEGPGAGDAQRFIVALSRDIEREDAAARKLAEDRVAAANQKAAADAAARAQAEHDAAQTTEPEVPEPTAPIVTPAPVARGGGALRLAGLITGGVGVVLIGVGVGFAIRAGSLSGQQSDQQAAFDPSLVSAGNAANRNAYLCVGVGAAALVGGGVMWYLGHRSSRRAGAEPHGAAQVRFTPALTPALAGIFAVGRF